MWAGPRYLLLLGGACPSVTALVARALPALRLVQVSFWSPGLSDRKRYGNLFGTAPSERALNQATVKLLQRYEWNRVGIITQEGPTVSEVTRQMSSFLSHEELSLCGCSVQEISTKVSALTQLAPPILSCNTTLYL